MSFIPATSAFPRCPAAATDEAWLEVVGDLGLLVITRDKRIRYRPVERQRWVDHRVRGFVLTGAGNMRIDDQLALIEKRWAAMERLVEAHPDGPWMYSVTGSGLRPFIAPP